MFNKMRKMRWVVIIMLTCCFMWVIDVDRWRIVFEIQRAEAQELQTQQDRRDMQTDFDTKLGELQTLLERLADEVASDSECEATYAKIMQKRDILIASFRETNASLDEMEAKLVQLGIESKIARLRQVRDEIQIKSERVFADLMAIEGKYKNISPVSGVYKTDEIIATRTELIGICRQLAEFLSRNRQEPLHQPLGRDLPHGGMTFDPITPTLGAESNGFVAGGRIKLPAGVERFSAPTSADLAATPEIQINDKIVDLAARLHNNPREIYYHVLNNYDYQPYYGSLKGSEGVRLEGIGNDVDLASFTMALLRASNVPCRYVYGLVEIPIESVMSWLMVKKPEVAVEMLQTKTGIPTAVRLKGNQIVSVQIEHVWVEAYIDSASFEEGIYIGCRWIPLDVSFKKHLNISVNVMSNLDIEEMHQSSLEMIENANVNEDLLMVDQIDSSAFISQITEWDSGTVSDTSFIDRVIAMMRSRRIINSQDGGLLPIELPKEIRVLRIDLIDNSIPVELSYKLNISVDNSTDGTLSLKTSMIPGHTIAVCSIPATEDDLRILEDSYLSDTTNCRIPAYLVNMKPVLLIDDNEVIAGNSTAIGEKWELNMVILGPNLRPIVLNNQLYNGNIAAVNFNFGSIHTKLKETHESLGNFIAQIDSDCFDLNNSRRLVLEKYNAVCDLYWAQVFLADEALARQNEIVRLRHISEGMMGIQMKIDSSFGMPIWANYTGLFIDVDRVSVSGISMNGDASDASKFQMASGIIASQYESAVLNQYMNSNVGLSTIDVFNQSITDNIPIYVVSTDNIGKVLPLLEHSPQVLTEITNAINAEYTVVIPEREIAKNGMVISGYIVQNDKTMEAGYYVAGGYSGAVASAIIIAIGDGMTVAMSKDATAMFAKTAPAKLTFGAGLTSLVFTGITVYNAFTIIDKSNLDNETKNMLIGLTCLVAVVAVCSTPWPVFTAAIRILLNLLMMIIGITLLVHNYVSSVTTTTKSGTI